MRIGDRQNGADLLTGIAARIRTSENAVLLALSAVLGLGTGLCIWLFKEAIELFHTLAIGLQYRLSPVLGGTALILSLALGGAIVGWIMERFIGEERHHGVAGVMEAVAIAGGRLRYQRMPFKAVASALSLGVGASIGPEDPSVQIGSNLGSWFGQTLGVKEDHVRLLVSAGAAAAIAAAFKAPIAGVFFALEVILNGAFETRSFGVIVLAAVMSSAFTQAIHPEPELGVFNYALGSSFEIPLFVPLGLILGLIAVLYVRIVDWQHNFWHHYIHLPRPARTALAGAIVGFVGIFLPHVVGTGRETMSAMLSGELHFTLVMLVALAAFKILMNAVSLAGGFVGGIFAPSLFVGTMIGSLYGQLVTAVLPGTRSGEVQAYAIVGMAATMAGIFHSPITAIMLVFELTNDYRLILPMMLTTVICVYLAEKIEPHGIYMKSLINKGVHIPQGREIDLMQGVTVGEAMLKPAPVIQWNASLTDLRDTLQSYHSNSLCVLDDEGLLCGIVTLTDLQRAYTEAKDPAPMVKEVCSANVVTVYPEQQVWEAIRIMSTRDIGRLPVVKRGTRELLGLIGRHGVVRAYNVAITRKLAEQHLAEQIRLNTMTGGHIIEHVVTRESPVARQRICEIAWPVECAVVGIHRHGRLIVPHGDTEIHIGDKVILLSNRSVERDLTKLFASV